MTNDIKVRLLKKCSVILEAADYIERLEAQLEDAANSGLESDTQHNITTAWETGYNRGHTDALEEAAKTEEER